MRLSFSVLFLTGFLCIHISSFEQDIHFSLVNRSQEDAGSIILGMAQDAEGFLWFATTNGLYKYDGYQYSSYHNEPLNPNSPAANGIESITADKAGYLWLAPRGSGIDRFDPATGMFTHFRHLDNDPGSLANDTVNVIITDREGTLWIGSYGGLDKFDSKTNKFLHYRHNANDAASLSCNVVRAIYEDKQGIIWAGTGSAFFLDIRKTEGGLNKLDNTTGKFTRYMHDDKDPHSLIDNRVRAIFEDSHGIFWVGTAGDGLHTMNRKNGTFERHLYDPLHPDKLSRPPVKNIISYADDHITFITEDNKERIWIGTFEGGINVYDKATQKVSYYGSDKNSKENLGENGFWTAYKTRENIIWISTWENNLYKVSPYQNVLPHNRIGKTVFCFAEDNANTLWLGTKTGLVHKYNNGKEEQFLIDKNSSSYTNLISYIEREDSNKFWLATLNGLYLFNTVTKTFTGYHHLPGNPNSMLSDTIFYIKKSPDNKLWVGTYNGLNLIDTKAGTFRHFQNNLKDTASINNNYVYAVYSDRNKNVWVGTYSGLNRLDKQTGDFKRYLNKSTVNCIVEDKGGTLWVGTTTGLFTYIKATDNFSSITDDLGIITSTNRVDWITEDHEQNLWLNTAKGIVRFDQKRNNAVLYSTNQGVNSLATTNFGYTRQNGEILYGDTSGYFAFIPNLLEQNVLPPAVTISNFLLNNVPVKPSANGILTLPLIQTKNIRLNHKQNTFSFEFSNIDFLSAHGDTRLLYTLENYDNAWHKAGEERTAYYFNLPPGKYIFRVKALSAASVAVEKDIAITITPAWYRTWWAYTIFVSFCAGLIWAFIVYRSRKLKRANKALEEKVERRTTQLKQSLENLKATQNQLIQSEKMASLGELTAGIAHEIQNPLNFVNNFSEVNTELVDELKEELKAGNTSEAISIANDIRENEQKINHHGKRADAIVKGMLQHSRKNTGQKEPTDINALCDEFLRLSYFGLRAKDKNFNADFKTDFDESIGKINIVPQDIGRVLLNLFNNAFYAVNEKKKTADENYEPLVTIATKNSLSFGEGRGEVEIQVTDNGNGIPQNIVDKIFQPFFTTKPTGQGTGLGLSLAYDIIKAHSGEIKVETKEGEGCEFIIQLSAI